MAKRQLTDEQKASREKVFAANTLDAMNFTADVINAAGAKKSKTYTPIKFSQKEDDGENIYVHHGPKDEIGTPLSSKIVMNKIFGSTHKRAVAAKNRHIEDVTSQFTSNPNLLNMQSASLEDEKGGRRTRKQLNMMYRNQIKAKLKAESASGVGDPTGKGLKEYWNKSYGPNYFLSKDTDKGKKGDFVFTHKGEDDELDPTNIEVIPRAVADIAAVAGHKHGFKAPAWVLDERIPAPEGFFDARTSEEMESDYASYKAEKEERINAAKEKKAKEAGEETTSATPAAEKPAKKAKEEEEESID